MNSFKWSYNYKSGLNVYNMQRIIKYSNSELTMAQRKITTKKYVEDKTLFLEKDIGFEKKVANYYESINGRYIIKAERKRKRIEIFYLKKFWTLLVPSKKASIMK